MTTRYYGWYANRPRGRRRQAKPVGADPPRAECEADDARGRFTGDAGGPERRCRQSRCQQASAAEGKRSRKHGLGTELRGANDNRRERAACDPAAVAHDSPKKAMGGRL